MEVDRPLKEGHLLFPPQGVLGNLKKSWHKKYCQLFKSSKNGIERLEVFDNEADIGNNISARIITLENCVKITVDAQKHQPHVFAVVTKTTTYHMAAIEESELPEWLSLLQSVAFKGDPVVASVEENELYCSSGEGIFTVKLVKSEASTRCNLEHGVYTLVLTSTAIHLRDAHNQKLITWPYLFIRRYGYRESKFTFEAGRKCETGEGEFGLEHSNPQEIYRCLSLKMKNMRKLLGGDVSSSPAIFCGDNSNQFQAALSMEARSRSPLPPSPTSSTNILEMDFNSSTQPGISMKLANAPSVDNFINVSLPALPLKPKSLSINNLSHVPNETPPLPIKPKPLISPTVETNPLLIINAPPYLTPHRTISHGALDTISSRKSPTLFRAKLVDIDISSDAPPLKPKPSKPPRKHIFTPNTEANRSKRILKQRSEQSLLSSTSSLYKSQTSLPNDIDLSNNNSNSYDEVEFRHDAWRTLGLDNFHHTERPSSTITPDDARDYEAIEKLPSDTKQPAQSLDHKPKFLTLKPHVAGDYDTLQHFGSKKSCKSGYKQIVVVNSNPSSPATEKSNISLIESYTNQNHTFHDYDEVEEPMEACRLADDSHLGYGMIRRPSVSNDLDDKVDLRMAPKHKVYDNLEYAIVAKPKHV